MQFQRSPNWLIAVSVVFVLVAGCEREALFEGEEPESAFAGIQQQIFNTNCALSGCHLGPGATGALNLAEGQAYDNLVGVTALGNSALLRVDPGNPDDSYLVVKIEAGPPDKFRGLPMPFGRPQLSQEQIQMIRDWISDGAPRG